jgi:hypothetical protein
MFKSQAKLGVISAQAITDGTYSVLNITASKPKNGYCNPLLELQGYQEKLYVHPTKLTGYCKQEGETYQWSIPNGVKGLKVVILAGSVTLSFPSESTNPEDKKPTSGRKKKED